MPSLAEQAIMIEALSGDSDREFPHSMAAYREEARRNPNSWGWCLKEDRRRKMEKRNGRH